MPWPRGSPTAVQSVAVGQETALSSGDPDAGLGVAWIVHAEPFQRSANVLLGNVLVVE